MYNFTDITFLIHSAVSSSTLSCCTLDTVLDHQYSQCLIALSSLVSNLYCFQVLCCVKSAIHRSHCHTVDGETLFIFTNILLFKITCLPHLAKLSTMYSVMILLQFMQDVLYLGDINSRGPNVEFLDF